jgi:hypothetical protein
MFAIDMRNSLDMIPFRAVESVYIANEIIDRMLKSPFFGKRDKKISRYLELSNRIVLDDEWEIDETDERYIWKVISRDYSSAEKRFYPLTYHIMMMFNYVWFLKSGNAQREADTVENMKLFCIACADYLSENIADRFDPKKMDSIHGDIILFAEEPYREITEYVGALYLEGTT